MANSIAEALGKAAEEKDEPESEEGDGDTDAHGVEATKQFASALKSGDFAGAWDAYKTMHKLCSDYEEDEETGEE